MVAGRTPHQVVVRSKAQPPLLQRDLSPLPCYPRLASGTRIALSHRATPPACYTAGMQKIILLCEDDPDIAELMAMVLGTRHTVVPAADGETAIRVLCGPCRPDLLLTDLQLPGIDGLAVARMARLLLPGLPILLCSGSGIRPAGEGALYDAYLAKPFDIATLLAAADGLLRGAERLAG